jgi:hypothetical protein
MSQGHASLTPILASNEGEKKSSHTRVGLVSMFKNCFQTNNNNKILKGSAFVQNRPFKHKLFVLNRDLWSGNNGLEPWK